MLEQLPGLLLPWFAEHRRDLPWRRDREPYHVWLSEIMLQQTRVEAVRGYYLRFLERLPDIAALASAPEDVLLKLWEGLGYYSRVRNLQKAAQCVMEQHGGEFPQELSAIRALPGIGDYTAGAIASICFEAPTAAVDGNVLRVILRLTVCADSPADVRVRRRIGEELSAVYPAGHCGDFTQALMELGATVCLPNGAPQCGACPLRALCEAHAQAGVAQSCELGDAAVELFIVFGAHQHLKFIGDLAGLEQAHCADLNDLPVDLHRQHLLRRIGAGPRLIPLHVQNDILHGYSSAF